MHVRPIRSYENVLGVTSLLHRSATQLHTLLPDALSPDEFDVHTPMTQLQATEGGTGHSMYCREKKHD